MTTSNAPAFLSSLPPAKSGGAVHVWKQTRVFVASNPAPQKKGIERLFGVPIVAALLGVLAVFALLGGDA